MDFLFFFVVIACAAVGYLLGSLNFAIIIVRLFKNKDIRDFGSKNAGMTNVLRTFGKKYAAMVLLGDLLKGVVAVLIARLVFMILNLDQNILGFIDNGVFVSYIVGIAAILGHTFPIYFKFKGGKGVLTSAGIMLVINPFVFLICIVIFALSVIFSKIVSLSSIICAVAFPVFIALLNVYNNQPFLYETIFAGVIGLFIILMHRENIVRLINGTENKFGKKK